MSNSRDITEERRLAQRLHKAAWEEWVRGRKKSGVPSFIGKSIRPRVREQVEVAMVTCDERDVLDAVHQLSREPDGAPWDIPKRAMYLGSQRRDLEHLDRKMHQRTDDERAVAIKDAAQRVLRTRSGSGLDNAEDDDEKEKGIGD